MTLSLADSHYTICPNMLTKRSDIEDAEDYWQLLVQQYRARVEHSIGRLTAGFKLFREKPRINYDFLYNCLLITAHTGNIYQRTRLSYPLPDAPSEHYINGRNVFVREIPAPLWIWNEPEARRLVATV